LGGTAEFEVDVRVVAATNKIPEQAVRGGHLREDLYYRLNVFHIHLPPLREGKQDICAAVRNMIWAGVSEKRAMEISGHKTNSMFKRYDITDERDIQADGQRLARYLEEKAKLAEERRKLEVERAELEKVRTKVCTEQDRPADQAEEKKQVVQ